MVQEIFKRSGFTGFFMLVLLAGCSSSSDDPDPQAQITPAVNPAFDSIDLVATSDSAGGDYSTKLTKDTDYSYDEGSEKIQLKVGAITGSGLYLKITGKATLDGIQDEYTVYTFVASNDSKVAANELTSIAVIRVAKSDSASFNEAVKYIADKTGLSASDITASKMARNRNAQVTQTMRMFANQFKIASASTPGLTSSLAFAFQSVVELEKVALGAQAYDNWLKIYECKHNSSDLEVDVDIDHEHEHGCARPSIPAEVVVKKNESDSSTYVDFVRCVTCHGWDRLGNDGALKHQIRNTASEGYISGPNAGKAATASGADDTNTNSRNLSTANFDAASITKSTSNIRYAGNARPSGNVTRVGDWNGIVNTTDDSNNTLSNKHPDYEGGPNSVVPNTKVIEALVAFLNYDDGAASKVFTTVNVTDTDVTYELVGTANAENGAKYYAQWCFRCHGAPDNRDPNVLNRVEKENFKDYLATNTNYASLRHIAQFGKSGTAMTRARLGYPSSANVADIIAFLNNVKSGVVTSGAGFSHMGKKEAGQAFYDKNCANCHSAGTYDKTQLCFDHTTSATKDNNLCSSDDADAPDLAKRHPLMQSDLTASGVTIMSKVTKLTQQNINDLAAFFTSELANP